MPDDLDQGHGNAAAPVDRRVAPRPETSEFVELLKSRDRGKLKVYVGSAAGVGKTVRMLQEAHDLRRRGTTSMSLICDAVSARPWVSTNPTTTSIPRRQIAYRGVTLE